MSNKTPEYGEYASLEQQRARMGVPAEGHAPTPVIPAGQRPQTSAGVPIRPAGYLTGNPSGLTPEVQPAGDRIVSIVLLSLGALSLMVFASGLLNLGASLTMAAKQLGIEGYVVAPNTNSWGVAAFAAMVIIFIFAVWRTFRRLRAGKLSWWIPLLSGVIAISIYTFVVASIMTADPAFQDFIANAGR